MNFLFLKLSKYVLGQYVSKSFPKWWARWINIHKNTHSHGQSWVCVAFLIHQLQAHSFPSLKNEYWHERESHTKALNLLTFKYEKQVLEKAVIIVGIKQPKTQLMTVLPSYPCVWLGVTTTGPRAFPCGWQDLAASNFLTLRLWFYVMTKFHRENFLFDDSSFFWNLLRLITMVERGSDLDSYILAHSA